MKEEILSCLDSIECIDHNSIIITEKVQEIRNLLKEQKVEQRLYAFWRYDIFPYVCAGEVEEINEKGNVKIKEYGSGWFVPLKIFPYETGKNIMKELEQLGYKYREDSKKLLSTYKESLPLFVKDTITKE